MAIATKGWSERELLWEIPFQKLVLYSLCIPSYEEKGSGKRGNGEEIDAFDFFENL